MSTDSLATPLAEHHKRVAELARAEHDDLLDAVHALEASLVSAAPGREQAWCDRVGRKLHEVVKLLDHHAASAESDTGLLAVIAAAQPRLLHRTERLRKDHDDLRSQAAALKRRIEHHADHELPNYRDIRYRTTWLLNALRHHRADATDLIFETFSTDIGGGD